MKHSFAVNGPRSLHLTSNSLPFALTLFMVQSAAASDTADSVFQVTIG
jgi:hypothetical protein